MVGLDIGSKSIKIIEIEKEAGRLALKASGVVGHSGVSISKLSDAKAIAEVGQIIKKLHKETGISTKEVAIAIPESNVFTRTIKFPMLTDTEIASAVKWEAEQYIPIPASEAVIQHTVLERNEKATPPAVTVLLVAAPKVIVEKYVGVVSAAGLTATAVETQLLALSRALAIPGKVILLVDMGASSTDIAICKNGMLYFSRSIPVAGDALSRAVSQGLGVSAAQAEEYKKVYGMDSGKLEGKVREVLIPVLKMITDEIKKAVHFYESEDGGSAPSVVIISGGSVGLPGANTYITQQLGIEVAIANPFNKVSLSAQTAKNIAPYAPIYAIAAGLAMRGV